MSFITLLFCMFAVVTLATMPSPFTRELMITDPYQTGNDVIIAQNLLKRDGKVGNEFVVNGIFDEASEDAVKKFQSNVGIPVNGILDELSAQTLLDLYSGDGIKDSGFTAESMGYLYKFHIPVHSNRSVETYSTLFDAKGNILFKFRTRTHGHRGDGTTNYWPDFGNGDVGLNQFTTSGNTVTGIVEVDLNSPEPDPALYGPWPVNRLVRGLDGNAGFLLPNIRDGILIHTGNWTTEDVNWNPMMTMPNSAGCIHAHPSEVERIYKTLVDIGVTVNDNTFSGKNYPYKPQGIAVIELID